MGFFTTSIPIGTLKADRALEFFNFSIFQSTLLSHQCRTVFLSLGVVLMADDSEFVRLNVGGTKFVSTKTTLCLKGSSQPSTFFTALLSGMF